MTTHLKGTGLLSIIVPVYNVACYLPEALDSLLAQDYKNIEILLIDDGSTDDSLSVCKRYAKEDDRIRLYSQDNQGLAITRSRGLDYATGEYVTFADSDDTVLPTTYIRAIEILQQNPQCDHVQFPLHKRVGTPNPEIIVNNREAIYGSLDMLHNWVVERDISWIVCNKIFKREAIGDLRFKAGFVYEDNLFVAQQLKRSKGICFSTEGAYLYHYRGGSITNTFTQKNLLDMIQIHIDIYRELEYAPELSVARGYMLYMIACDVYAEPRWSRGESLVAQLGLHFLRNVPCREVLGAKGLLFKRKLKTLIIIMRSYLWLR